MGAACRLGDKAKAPIDTHGCPHCPHPNVQGPAISASSNVYISGMPALRIDDIGMHSVCCGTQMWKVVGASAQVFVNGSQMVRKGDPTLHCGGVGEMITASANVVDGSPTQLKGPFAPLVAPPLPLNQVLVFPDMEPECVSPTNRGGAVQTPDLPTSGDPRVYDANAAAAARAARLPHAEAGPTPEQEAASQRRLAANYWLAGNDEGYQQATARAGAESRLAAARELVANLSEAAGAHGEALKKAQENLRVAEAAVNNPRGASGEVIEEDPNLEELP